MLSTTLQAACSFARLTKLSCQFVLFHNLGRLRNNNKSQIAFEGQDSLYLLPLQSMKVHMIGVRTTAWIEMTPLLICDSHDAETYYFAQRH